MLRNAVWFLWGKFWSFSSNLANNIIYQIISFIWLNNFNVVVLCFENKSLMFTLAISLESICHIFLQILCFLVSTKELLIEFVFMKTMHIFCSAAHRMEPCIYLLVLNKPTVSKHINEIVKKRNLELFVDAIFNFKIWFYVK